MSGVMNPGQRVGSLLDQVAKGVAIATQVYGIKQSMDKSDADAEERARQQADEDALAAGKPTPGQRLKLASQGISVSDKPFEGGIAIPGKDGGITGYVGKQTAPSIRAPTTKEVGGSLVQYDDKTGKWVPAYTAPAKPEKQETGSWSAIGVDDNGNTILHNSKTNKVVTGPKQGVKPNDKQPSDTQIGAAGFAKRAIAADAISNDLVGAGYDPTNWGASIRANVPLISGKTMNEDDKRFKQAKDDFISAVLRKESGAAISKDEYSSEDRKYFPQLGDTPEVIAQKAQSRSRAIETLKAQAGSGFDKVGDVPTNIVKREAGDGTAIAAPQGQKGKMPSGTPPKPDKTILDYAVAYDLDYQTAAGVLAQRGHK